jgi:DNA-binding MarR family transcriptional regulator
MDTNLKELDWSIRWLKNYQDIEADKLLSPHRLLILLVLLRMGGSMGQQELWEEANGNRAALSRSVLQMANDGLVESSIDPMNRSRRVVTLTKAGRALLDRLWDV